MYFNLDLIYMLTVLIQAEQVSALLMFYVLSIQPNKDNVDAFVLIKFNSTQILTPALTLILA